MMIDYVPHALAPPMWEHQRRCLDVSGDLPNYAILFEQRCGKTRALLDTVAHWHDLRKVDRLLVVSWPAGLHLNWLDEVGTYVPERCRPRSLAWRSGRIGVSWQNTFDALLEHSGLGVFSINAEAIGTPTASRFIKRFLDRGPTFLAVDEADFAKSPVSLRTRTIQTIAGHPNVVARRILTGTPATENPLEFYSQFAILDPAILGHRSYFSFKSRYAVLEDQYVYQNGARRSFKAIRKDDAGRPMYRNVEELKRRIAPFSMRVTRAEVSDAPPKVYQIRRYLMSDVQRRVYDRLRDEFRAETADGTITALHVFRRLSMLQHVLGNVLPDVTEAVPCPECSEAGCDACDGTGSVVETRAGMVVDPGGHPRLEALRAELEANPGVPTIVWAKYRHEVDGVIELVTRDLGLRFVRFDGSNTPEERREAIRAFQSGEADVLVGNPAAGGRGLRLDRAELMVFYSNVFSLRVREQAEDRAESIGRKISTGIVDICAIDSIDEYIRKILYSKKSLSDNILRGEWL